MTTSAVSRALTTAHVGPDARSELLGTGAALTLGVRSDPVVCVSPNSLSAPLVPSSQDQDGGGGKLPGIN